MGINAMYSQRNVMDRKEHNHITLAPLLMIGVMPMPMPNAHGCFILFSLHLRRFFVFAVLVWEICIMWYWAANSCAQVLSYRNALTKPKQTANHKIMCCALVLFFFYFSTAVSIHSFIPFSLVAYHGQQKRRMKEKITLAAAAAPLVRWPFHRSRTITQSILTERIDSRIQSWLPHMFNRYF